MISEYRHTTIYCDLEGPECTGAFEVSGWSFVENRKEARGIGWRLGKDSDYCPSCKDAARQPVMTQAAIVKAEVTS